jgi:ubiquinone/menaquinone biosynthesis C-methylase UbiE
VACSCGDFRDTADRQFTDAKAAKELDVYRRGRVGTTTRTIRDAVQELGLNNGSLLDIGGGFGPLTFELLERGMPRATLVDASSAYVAAARDEAARRGRSRAIETIHGDVVQLVR